MLATRSIDLPIGDGGALPTEFRLFRAGENDTTKGVFIFDAKSAEMVLAAASEHGVDLMLDLEHLSLDTDARNFDPDARAWFRLEVRGGELWAVDVRWTPDGARRLTERTQRYVSPAFTTDDEGRITEIVNVALVAMPATHGTPALVAAGRRSRMTVKDQINKLSARLAYAKSRMVRLADDAPAEGDAPSGKGAQVKSAAEGAAAALEELVKVVGGGADMDTVFGAMEAAQKSIDELEKAMSAFGIMDGDAANAAPAPEATAAAPAEDETQRMARERAELIALRAEKAKREQDEKIAKLAAEMTERAALEAELVKLGRETPHTVKMLSGLPLSQLRERVAAFKRAPAVSTLSRVAPPSEHTIEITDTIGMTETEATYLKARHGMMLSQGAKLRSLDETHIRYLAAKQRQLSDAQEKGEDHRAKLLAAPIRGDVVRLASRAGLVALASTPVQPIEEFGASSQIALQSFRLEYNIALASMPSAWAETVGQMLSDGAMKTTFPISYDATEYQEKAAPNAAANQAQSFDIEVKQREFFGAKQVELRRLVKGDFAYVQRWAQSAAEMARARVFLRNKLVATLLESGLSGYWGQSATLATGIDGQPFFSASHKINPSDPSRKLRTVATFSNYQSSATPLNAANLTAEKNAALQVAAPDGRELGIVFDGILYPSALEQTAANLLKVQDLILDAKNPLNGVANAMGGGVRNPHYQSGMDMVRAMDLAGTDTTANYYLFSREGISRGLPPWVICEDPTEEIRLWDESSDFYKSSGFIKIESHVFLNAVLAFPHCIRLVKGA